MCQIHQARVAFIISRQDGSAPQLVPDAHQVFCQHAGSVMQRLHIRGGGMQTGCSADAAKCFSRQPETAPTAKKESDAPSDNEQ